MVKDSQNEGQIAALTIADEIFGKIRNAIIVGQIPAGSKISEPNLAKEYGISRGPLREALSRLEASNLIERKPNIGARVVTLSHEKLLEIYHIRESLEGLAARQAAEAMTEDEISDLEQLLEDHRVQAKTNQNYFQKEGDMDFHFRIVQGSKNTHLIKLICHDLYYLVRLYRCQFGMVGKRVSRAFDEHVQIVDAIRQRDGELAEFLMARHIKNSRINVDQYLKDNLVKLG